MFSSFVFLTLLLRHFQPTKDPVRMLTAVTLDAEKACLNDGSQSLPKADVDRTATQGPDMLRASSDDLPPLAPLQEELIEEDWPCEWLAWLCLFGCFLLMFNSWGLVNAYGTYSSYYNQHLLPRTSITLLNLVGSTQSAIVLGLSFVVGRLLDAGHSRKLLGVGTFLVTLGMFMLSLANESGGYGKGHYGAIWATQGLVTGLGMACFFVSSSQIVATWFHKRKGFAVGIVASGASISGLIYPVMTKYLINGSCFNNAVRYVATLVGVTAMVSFFTAKPNPAHKYRKPKTWNDRRVWVDTHAFRRPAFCWFVASISILFFGFYAVFFNLEEWAVDRGVGYKDTAREGDGPAGEPHSLRDGAVRTFWLLSIMNASSTAGRLLSALTADCLGALNLHIFVTLISSLLILILWTLTTTVAHTLAFVVLFGAFSGAVIGLPPASMAYLLGPDKVAQAKLGQWVGMMYTVAAPFALTGPVIAGHLVTEHRTFLTVQVWSGVCLLLSGLCMAAARLCYETEADAAPAERKGVWRRAFSRANTLVAKEDEEAGVMAASRQQQSPSPQEDISAEKVAAVRIP